ncbi:prepilin-type cleavage/methylation domain-containing protein [Enterococcus sp. BWM-S5]|uniref:Prepilin-type cleavage/methylation domain-containing protein n=1 Tax=Enterococcus larvae TaxID=2794352 RepID=A0ABS4CGE3_9ENTE|nr:competence type IV pilus minor pilin ComGD [Enterococcus larvae]MBP1045221.1 prepilin-type cleavage/methylation domain-containing protein [Enterococcus larvae]
MVETLLVLLVTTFLIGLPSLLIEKSQKNIVVNQFFASFEKHLLHTQQLAITGEQDTSIIFSEGSDEVLFYFDQTKETLRIPEELKAAGPEKIVFKQGTGNNGRLSKYSFEWKDKKKRIDYQFQMGSGRYVKKIIAL